MTGASGSVGSVAVEILAKLGFHVVAVSGKENLKSHLMHLGAKEIVGRDAISESPKPLLKPEYAHAIDVSATTNISNCSSLKITVPSTFLHSYTHHLIFFSSIFGYNKIHRLSVGRP